MYSHKQIRVQTSYNNGQHHAQTGSPWMSVSVDASARVFCTMVTFGLAMLLDQSGASNGGSKRFRIAAQMTCPWVSPSSPIKESIVKRITLMCSKSVIPNCGIEDACSLDSLRPQIPFNTKESWVTSKKHRHLIQYRAYCMYLNMLSDANYVWKGRPKDKTVSPSHPVHPIPNTLYPISYFLLRPRQMVWWWLRLRRLAAAPRTARTH